MNLGVEPSMLLDSSDIAKVLSSSGPVVKCVLLKAPIASTDGATEDGTRPSQPPTSQSSDDKGTQSDDNGSTNDLSNESPKIAPRIVLRDLMEEIEIDTTPAKSMVSQILGGPFTFLGQYEEEGIVLMIRKLPVDLDRNELAELKPSELRHLCQEREIPMDHMIEKSDLIEALVTWSNRSDPPWNPHALQPPLQKEPRIRGDILVMKVAETKEELDQEDNLSYTPIEVPTNDEFFLDYTLEEYIQFASRTDIPDYELEVNDEENDEAEGEDDEEGEEEENYVDDDDDGEVVEGHDHGPQELAAEGDDAEGVPLRFGDDVEIDDEDRAAMFNLVMNEVLRQYREENGRGPDTKELLEIRASIAKELDVPVAHFDAEQADWNKHAKDGTPAKENAKTIAFHTEDRVLEYQPDPNEHNYDDLEHEQGFEQRRRRREEDDDHDEQDEADDNKDDDDDDYKSARLPRKRRRLIDDGAEASQDSKLAASTTKFKHENSAQELDQGTNHGDDASGIAHRTNKATEKR